MNKILFCADCHTGSRTGLTPPEYQGGGREWVRDQVAKWEWFENVLETHGPFRAMIGMGDIVDLGVKDQSEIIMDAPRMINAAIEIVRRINAPINLFVYGTRVHTSTRDGIELDLEVAKHINGVEDPKIYDHLWADFGGKIADIKHAPTSRSRAIVSKFLPLMNERIFNEQASMKGYEPLSQLYFRAHLHTNADCGVPGEWHGYNVPCLQGIRTKYSRIISSGAYTEGVGILTLTEDWPRWEVIELPATSPQIYPLSVEMLKN